MHDTLEKVDQNRMHARNLAIVWAPNLMRANDTDALLEAQLEIDIVEYMITNFAHFFPTPYVELPKQLETPGGGGGGGSNIKAVLGSCRCRWNKRDGKLCVCVCDCVGASAVNRLCTHQRCERGVVSTSDDIPGISEQEAHVVDARRRGHQAHARVE
jgi:hypothetical protein